MDWWYYVVVAVVVLYFAIRMKSNSKKFGAAANALLVEHLLETVELVPENSFAKELKEGIVKVWRLSGFPSAEESWVVARFNGLSRLEQLNMLAMVFNELGHHPMLANEFWHPVKSRL